MNKYIILGGGIAGLACAIQLLKSGKKVELFEKNAKKHGQGHAFILMPNGLKALETLGVHKTVLETAHPVQQFQLNQPDGKLITHQNLQGAVGIRRAALMDILAKVLPDNFIQHDKAFSHFKTDSIGHAQEAVFQDGTRAQGQVFIGADGIWSKTRQSIFPNFTLSPVRVREIVSVVKAPNLVKEFKGTFCKIIRKSGGLAVGMLPCDKNHIVWFIQYDCHHPNLLETTLSEQKERLFQTVRTWCHPLPELVRLTDFKQSYTWHTTDMEPLPSFYKNNIALIGDAAHVLLTLTSQGVSTALEDAISLTDKITNNGFVSNPLEAFTLSRRKTVEDHFWTGRKLKEQFLFPMQNANTMDVPLAFCEV